VPWRELRFEQQKLLMLLLKRCREFAVRPFQMLLAKLSPPEVRIPARAPFKSATSAIELASLVFR
jgi:hypothetical protein